MSLISADLLLQAYKTGSFPMAENRDDKGFALIQPEKRGILPLKRFHIPKRLQHTVASEKFTLKFNTVFYDVIHNCAARTETWINEDIIKLFIALHERGHAHSIEVWREGRLAGGIYGLAIGGVFFGESMFSAERDASKVALVHLVEHLKMRGYALFDVQFVNDHLKQFGVLEIGAGHFQTLLKQALALNCQFYP